jgi:hypothetical protein
MLKYKIILAEFPESCLNDSVVEYIGWEILSTIVPEHILEKNTKHINWTSVSARLDISDRFVEKYYDKIDWCAYLMSEKPKNIDILVKNRERVIDNIKIFKEVSVKSNYYSDPEFIDVFSEIIDWIWYAQYKKIPEYLIDRYWSKLNPSLISSNQNLTNTLYEKYWKTLDWLKISKYQKLDEKTINLWRHLVQWKEIFTYQKLSNGFLDRYKFNCPSSNVVIPAHQNLSETFIANNSHWLDMNTVCLKQKMSYEFLKKYQECLNFNALYQNVFYNTKNSIQVIRHNKTHKYYIIPETESKRINFVK